MTRSRCAPASLSDRGDSVLVGSTPPLRHRRDRFVPRRTLYTACLCPTRCSSTRSRSTWSSNIRRSGGGPTTGTASCGTCSCRWGRRACSRGSCLAGRSSRINSQTNYIQVYILAPGVDAEHPEKYEHVERDGQRDQREDHPAVGANSEESRVVDAVVDLQLLRGAGQYLVGRLGARRERRELVASSPWKLEDQCSRLTTDCRTTKSRSQRA